jgi:hypothetical protein
MAVVIASVENEVTPGFRGWIPAKLFETIGLNTPVLLIGPPDTDVERIGEPTGLIRRFTGSDVRGIASFIAAAISGPKPTRKHVDGITWNSIGTQLHAVLSKIAADSVGDGRASILNQQPYSESSSHLR